MSQHTDTCALVDRDRHDLDPTLQAVRRDLLAEADQCVQRRLDRDQLGVRVLLRRDHGVHAVMCSDVEHQRQVLRGAGGRGEVDVVEPV